MKSEYEEQKELIKYLDFLKFKTENYIKFTSIPNSTYTEKYQEKIRNTLSGLRAGFPDLFIIINNKVLIIEMKRVAGGIVSDKQRGWIDALNNAGIETLVCKGFLEAKAVIDKYLKDNVIKNN